MTLGQGAIIGGLVAVPDLDAALADYRDRLGLALISYAALDRSLAESWGCAENAGARMAVLQPRSEVHCFLRLVEQPLPADFVPTRTYGWASYELSVQDVFSWPDRLAGSGFDIVGPPKEIAGFPYFVAMQIHGPGREMLYLNEVRCDTPSNDLPRATSPIDQIFIAILAAPDRAAAVHWYRDRLGLDEGDSYVIEYSMINNAFALSAGTTSGLTMIQKGRLPIIEIDDYPETATVRKYEAGQLPPGNAMLSLAVTDLDACDCDWITSPRRHDGQIYGGGRSAVTTGAAGELIELVEIAAD